MEDIPTKNPGDQLTSGEFNSSNDEEKNVVTNSGQALNPGDSAQFTKAASNYTGSADYFIDSGVADAYVINAISPKLAPTAYADGLRVRFIPTNTNTGASTVNLNSLGSQAIKKYGRTVDVEPGDLTQGRVTELTFNQSDDVFELISLDNPIVVESIPLFKSFSGLALSNNVVTPDTKLDIAAGTFKDRDTAAASTLSNPLIKLLDAVWLPGDNVGGRASAVALTADTWYHVFIIAKPDGTTDVGFDTNINAANLLVDAVGFTLFRRRGSIFRDSIPAISKFISAGDIYSWLLPPAPVIVPNEVPSSSLIVVQTPLDVITKATVRSRITSLQPDANETYSLHMCHPDADITATLAFIEATRSPSPASFDINGAAEGTSLTDTSSQIRFGRFNILIPMIQVSIYSYEEINL